MNRDPFGQFDLFTPEAAEDLIAQLRAKHGAANVVEVSRNASLITLRITADGVSSLVSIPLTTGFPRHKEPTP